MDTSPLEVFKQFDMDKDGTISRHEFITALESMKISMGQTEQEIFFLFLDLDGQGQIKYSEFLRILQRSGLQSISSDEKIIYMIYNVIQSNGLTLLDAFKAFYSNQDNQISCNEMAHTLMSMDSQLKRANIDRFFRLADINGDG